MPGSGTWFSVDYVDLFAELFFKEKKKKKGLAKGSLLLLKRDGMM